MTLKNKEIVTGQAAAHTVPSRDYCETAAASFTPLTFTTRDPVPRGDPAPAFHHTHYSIMTILGCLFGTWSSCWAVYYCLRSAPGEEKQKSVKVKKTILEMRYKCRMWTPALRSTPPSWAEPHCCPVSQISSIPP